VRRPVAIAVVLVVAVPVAFVVEEAGRTLVALGDVERERDTWQRADAVLRELDLRPGATVVDFGSGAGYFALKMAPRVAPGGRVFAVDLRRESLTFLWIRAQAGPRSPNISTPPCPCVLSSARCPDAHGCSPSLQLRLRVAPAV